MASGLPGGGPPVAARAVRPRRRGGAARRGRRTRRIRWRAEVPAVGAAGGPAAQPRTHRRRGAAGDGRTHRRQRWRAAASTTSSPADSPATASTRRGWCRTSRRCSTTTRCCCGPTRTGRGAPEIRLARKVAGETARFLIDELGADGDVHLVAGRRRRRARGLTYVWTPAQLREVLGDDDGRWAAELFARHRRRARSSTAVRCCNCRRTPTTPDASSGSAPLCWPPG